MTSGPISIAVGRNANRLVVIEVGHDVMHSPGKRLDRTGVETSAVVVDALTPDAILLVVNNEGGTGGLEQLGQGGSVWNDSLSMPENDTLNLKLLGALLLLVSRPSVLTNP